MNKEIHAPGLLATVLPGHSLVKTYGQERAEIARRKAEYEAALERVKQYATKEGREKIRQQKRRDEIIGHLFSAVCETSPETWIQFEPDLERWLENADDADRALFLLPPLKMAATPKLDTKKTSKDPAPDAKKPSLKPDPVKQSTNQQTDPQPDSVQQPVS